METESHEYFYISTQMRIIVCLFFVIALCYTHALDCNSFDYSQIKLVTFDVFAALMDVISSTSLTVSEILSPWLPESDGRAFALAMVYGYSDFADHVFTEAEVLPLTFSLLNQQLIEIWPCWIFPQTGGLEPFQYVANATIVKQLAKMNLTQAIPVNSPVFLRVCSYGSIHLRLVFFLLRIICLSGGASGWTQLINAWGNLTPWPGVAPVLQRMVQAGYRVAPLSNGRFLSFSF